MDQLLPPLWRGTPPSEAVVLGVIEKFFIDNPLVRIHLIIEMLLEDRPCVMGSLNSHFQVAYYLPA